jgi:hypothetical protein
LNHKRIQTLLVTGVMVGMMATSVLAQTAATANQALDALQTIRSALKVGITFAEYRNLLVNATAVVDRLPGSTRKTLLIHTALDTYTLALTVWRDKNDKRFVAGMPKVEYAWDFVPVANLTPMEAKEVTAQDLDHAQKYRDEIVRIKTSAPVPPTPGSYYDPQPLTQLPPVILKSDRLQILWRLAGRYLDEAVAAK